MPNTSPKTDLQVGDEVGGSFNTLSSGQNRQDQLCRKVVVRHERVVHHRTCVPVCALWIVRVWFAELRMKYLSLNFVYTQLFGCCEEHWRGNVIRRQHILKLRLKENLVIPGNLIQHYSDCSFLAGYLKNIRYRSIDDLKRPGLLSYKNRSNRFCERITFQNLNRRAWIRGHTAPSFKKQLQRLNFI